MKATARRSACATRTLRVRGEKVRVWEKGRGRPLGVLSGLFGFPVWTPFLEALSQKRRVIVPSLPGHPGGGDFRTLDDLADWVIATQELLEAAGLEGADLVGLGPGGTLAAEAAAFSPELVKRLVLVAPFGLFDEREPVADFWAKRATELPGTFSAKPAEFAAQVLAPPAGADQIEFQVRAGALARSRRAPALALRRPRAREAPASHLGAHAAGVGQRGPHRARELREALRRRHRGAHARPLHRGRRPPRGLRRARRAGAGRARLHEVAGVAR